METLQIYLNSKYADVRNDSNLLFYLPQIEVESNNHIYITVKSASIPLTYYNVNDYNNTLVWGYLGGSVNVATLVNGNYNINNFIPMLNSALHNNFTIAYDSITNHLSFTSKNNTVFMFYNSSTCFDLLGIAGSFTYASDVNVLTSNKAVNLISITNILINSNFTTYNMAKYTDTNNKSALCSIPIDIPVNNILTYKGEVSNKINTFRNVLSEIHISLTDQNGNPLDLNNCNFTLTLQLDIVDFVDDD